MQKLYCLQIRFFWENRKIYFKQWVFSIHMILRFIAGKDKEAVSREQNDCTYFILEFHNVELTITIINLHNYIKLRESLLQEARGERAFHLRVVCNTCISATTAHDHK